jgi:hypothetical protein
MVAIPIVAPSRIRFLIPSMVSMPTGLDPFTNVSRWKKVFLDRHPGGMTLP